MNEIVGAGRLPDPLSERETRLLTQLEADIEANLKGFRKVGYALTVIRDQNLYRADYDTFEDYCRETWDMGRPRAYQLIDSHLVIENLSTMVDKCLPMGDKTDSQIIEMLPTNERQARPLSILSPEEQIEVWMMVIDTAKEKSTKITASMVEQCVNSVRHKKVRKAIDKAKKRTVPGEILYPEIREAASNLIDLVRKETDKNWLDFGKKEVIEIFEDLLLSLTEA